VRSAPLLPAVALLALVGCGEQDATVRSAPSRPPLLGAWELVEGRVEGEPLTPPGGTRATLVVEEATLGGTSFCNSYGSPYRLRDGALVLDGLAGTDMGCAPEVLEAERAYLQVLQRDGVEVTVDGDRLVLRGDDAELRFQRVPAVPTADLVGTRWVLETVLSGDVASSVAGEPATLRLGQDRSFTASTGCRSLSGTWKEYGDDVRLPSMRADGDCPANLWDQDGLVAGLLGDGFRAEVDDDRLTVSDGGEVRLVYRAG
jgi:heat shock protein HslJ